jgi:hypothetical protein
MQARLGQGRQQDPGAICCWVVDDRDLQNLCHGRNWSRCRPLRYFVKSLGENLVNDKLLPGSGRQTNATTDNDYQTALRMRVDAQDQSYHGKLRVRSTRMTQWVNGTGLCRAFDAAGKGRTGFLTIQSLKN